MAPGRSAPGIVAVLALCTACGGARAVTSAPFETRDAAAMGTADAAPQASSVEAGDTADAAVAVAPMTAGDTSFASDGLLGGPDIWIPTGVASDADGSLVVSGVSNDGTFPAAEIVRRVTPSGVIDPTFGASGRAVVESNPAFFAQSVAILPDRRVVVFGAANVDGGDGAFAVRLTATGSLDPTFGQGGLWNAASVGRGVAALFETDESLYAVGTSSVAHVTAAGALDPGFGSSQGPFGAAAGAVAGNGTFLTGAGAGLTRYSVRGLLDATFGNGGSVSSALDGATVRALLVDGSGRVVVAGSHSQGSQVYVDVARFAGTGAPDSAFAGGGVASIPADTALGVAERADGRIVVWTELGELVGFRADGTPDPSIGVGGLVGLGVYGTVTSGTVDAQNRLVVVGLTTQTASSSWFVRRYVL